MAQSKEILTAFMHVDRYPAAAKPNRTRQYDCPVLDTYLTFYHQLAMLGRPHAWMHFDNNNAVNDMMHLGDEELLQYCQHHSKSSARYFKQKYR